MIEVLVAMAIFSGAILALGSMQLAASNANTAAGRLSRATALAQDKAEQLMALAYDHASLRDLTPAGESTSYTDANPPAGYTVIWTVDQDRPAAGTKTVNITVTWKNRERDKTFSLAFYKDTES